MAIEDGISFGAPGRDRDSKELGVSGDSRAGRFRVGKNGALIFDNHRGTDAVFGVRRGDVVRGTGKPKNSGQGRGR